ncbi:MAG: hypothetical protein WBB38_02735 [Hyphomicrobiaceae bacterium]|jgi:hypothetical protein
MSTKAINAALDFMPSDVHRPRGVMDSVKSFFAAVRQGLDAAHEYNRLTARGVAPQKAVQIVFDSHFADRR